MFNTIGVSALVDSQQVVLIGNISYISELKKQMPHYVQIDNIQLQKAISNDGECQIEYLSFFHEDVEYFFILNGKKIKTGVQMGIIECLIKLINKS